MIQRFIQLYPYLANFRLPIFTACSAFATYCIDESYIAPPAPHHRFAILLFCCVLLPLLAGCKGPDWTGASKVTPDLAGMPADTQALVTAKPNVPILVVVTYPSTVEPGSAAEVQAAILRNERHVSDDFYDASPQHVRAALDETLVKSTLYAMECYQALRRRLPEGSVILQPMVLSADAKGNIQQTLKTELPPHAMRLDIWVRASLSRIRNGDMRSLDSFGRHVLLNINGFINDPALGPDEQHVLGYLAPHSRKANTLDNWLNDDRVVYPAAVQRAGDNSVLVHGRLSNVKRPANSRTHTLVIVPNKYEAEADYAQRYFKAPVPDAADAPFAPLFDRHANFIAEILTDLDRDRIFSAQFRAYQGRVGLQGADTQTLTKMANLERRFLVEQDAEFFELIYRGPFGHAVRQTLSAETDYDLALINAHERRQWAAMSQVFSMVAVSAVAQANRLSPQQSNALMLQNMIRIAQTQAGQSGQDPALQKLHDSMSQQLTRVRSAQGRFTVVIGGEEIELRADTLNDLRGKFAALLRSRR